MKILYTHLYDAAFGMGGAEKVMLDIALAARARGLDVRAAINKSSLADDLRASGIDVTEIFWQKSKSFQTLAALKNVCRNFKPYLIHSHHRYTTFLADVFFKRHIPVLHTEHVLRKDKRVLFRAGTKVTAVHESVAKNLVDFYHVPSERIITIPNAVKAFHFRTPVLESLRAKFPKVSGQLQILCVGRLEEQKGHVFLLQAVSCLSESEKSKFVFFLAGDGSLEGELKKRARELGVEKQFYFLGHTQDVPELLAHSDLVVLPSLWEGMPLSILEAFSAGKPVLATDIPGTRETMVDQVTGWLVRPADSQALADGLRRLSAHREDLTRLGQNAFERWRTNYSFDVLMERYLAVYRGLKSIHG